MAKNPLRHRRAQGMTEYIIIVGLIAIAVIGAVRTFGESVDGSFKAARDQVSADKIIEGSSSPTPETEVPLGQNSPNNPANQGPGG